MPILQVHCRPGAEVAERLHRACVAVADGLGLPHDAVIATHVPAGDTVRPGHPAADQVVVVVHSSPREAAAVDRARAALQTEADTWTPGEPAWVTWQTGT